MSEELRQLRPDLNFDPSSTTDLRTLGLDSLEILKVVGRVNTFFRLYDIGNEDLLLVRRSNDAWADLVSSSIDRDDHLLSFRSSGSTGAPQTFDHRLGDLLREVDFLSSRLQSGPANRQGSDGESARIRRVVGTVPSFHIYGFLFCGLLPERMNADFVDARGWPAGKWRKELRGGDLVVSFPRYWEYILDSLGADTSRIASAVRGTTSTAPLPESLRSRLIQTGFDAIFEVYGSSETAGLGLRRIEQDAYELFPYLEPDHISVSAPDDLEWKGERRFVPLRRKDGAMQVNGLNVYPSEVARRFTELPEIREAAVRKMAEHEGERLKAFLVPADGVGLDEAREAAMTFARAELTEAEQPASYKVGSHLPTNKMGKSADWEIA